MATVADMLENLKALDIKAIAHECNVIMSPKMLGEFKDQLWDGKNADGENITPSYLDDPYFKSKKQAQAYANWKNKITPNPKRDRNTPNLFINGYYYNTIDIDLGAGIKFKGWSPVMSKYGSQLNLNDDSKETIIKDGYLDEFSQKIESQTGLKIK